MNRSDLSTKTGAKEKSSKYLSMLVYRSQVWGFRKANNARLETFEI